MQRFAIAVLAVSTMSTFAEASNTAWKVNFPLRINCAAGGGQRSNLNWVSPPYFFYPDGDINRSPQMAIDWCEDLNGGPLNGNVVQNIQRFNTMSDTFTTKSCANPTPGFNLDPGIAYGLALAASQPDMTVIDLVGAHDDDYVVARGGTKTIPLLWAPGLSSLNWVSVPPHVVGTTAADLCIDLNGGPLTDTTVLSVQRFNVCEDTFTTKACSSPPAVPGFTLVPGAGYGMVPGSATNQRITLRVY